jgi:hypothetical protein
MSAIRRVARIVALTALLAGAGVALGFLVALMRPRPRSRYASPGDELAGPDAATGAAGGA